MVRVYTNAQERSTKVDRTALHEIATRCHGDVTCIAVHGRWPLGLLRCEFALDSATVESLSQDADLAKARVSAGPLDALLEGGRACLARWSRNKFVKVPSQPLRSHVRLC